MGNVSSGRVGVDIGTAGGNIAQPSARPARGRDACSIGADNSARWNVRGWSQNREPTTPVIGGRIRKFRGCRGFFCGVFPHSESCPAIYPKSPQLFKPNPTGNNPNRESLQKTGHDRTSLGVRNAAHAHDKIARELRVSAQVSGKERRVRRFGPMSDGVQCAASHPEQ
ncbi:hypothetical protein D3C72_1607690 [compost metagenome]